MLYEVITRKREEKKQNWMQKSILGPLAANGLMAFSNFCTKNVLTRILTVVAFTTVSVGTVVALKPSAEYLPQGNRNLILNILVPPPGYSVEKLKSIGTYIFDETRPYFDVEEKDGFPGISQLFYVGSDRFTLFGGSYNFV